MAQNKPLAAEAVEGVTGKSLYPEPFAARVLGRTKRRLGDLFGLANFGVNLTELAPGSVSALKHHHLKQDEFIYVLEGTPTLALDDSEYVMQPGDCIGFRHGDGIGHHLRNDSDAPVRYLEIGDRTEGDAAEYPDDDLRAQAGENGGWVFLHKNGTPY